jgi:hypothetical protein
MIRKATISSEGLYRYKLYRKWKDDMTRTILWVMLNPSTADDKLEDATIRRCIGFSDSWGYGALYVGNLNAYRSTNPKHLLPPSVDEALLNTGHILDMMEQSDLIVCAWGTMGLRKPPAFLGKELYVLGLTAEGYPKHPLRLRGDTPLAKWVF